MSDFIIGDIMRHSTDVMPCYYRDFDVFHGFAQITPQTKIKNGRISIFCKEIICLFISVLTEPMGANIRIGFWDAI